MIPVLMSDQDVTVGDLIRRLIDDFWMDPGVDEDAGPTIQAANIDAVSRGAGAEHMNDHAGSSSSQLRSKSPGPGSGASIGGGGATG